MPDKNTTVKKATVKYTPTTGGVTDTINASYNSTVLASQHFYIAPSFAMTWDLPEVFYITEQAAVKVTPTIGGCNTIDVTNLKISDSAGTTLVDEASYTLTSGTAIPFNYEPDASMTSVKFTIAFNLEDNSYTYDSDSVPVEKRSATYDLDITNPPLTYNQENTVELIATATDIETGATISFTSDYGLSATGTLEESSAEENND